MKRMFIWILTIAPVVGWSQSSNFVLEGKVGAYNAPAKSFLIYFVNGKQVVDSAAITKGIFKFSGTVTEPLQAQLVLDHYGEGLTRLGRNADATTLYLEKGNIAVAGKDSVKNASISGSKVNNDNNNYKLSIAKAEEAVKVINAEYFAAPAAKQKDPAFIAGLKTKFDEAVAKGKELQVKYVEQNPDSYVSLMVLKDLAGMDINVPLIEPLYNNLSADIRGTVAGSAFSKAINSARSTSIGAMAPLFTQKDANDKDVSLMNFRGKYVLLDFWASWCIPCRQENPNVLKTYNKYKTKNFTVLGVSLDRPGKREDWLAAIKADGLDWTQVSDLKFWDNEAAKLYNIKGIPQNYLIDPNGKIIAKNLRGDDLDKTLATLLK